MLTGLCYLTNFTTSFNFQWYLAARFELWRICKVILEGVFVKIEHRTITKEIESVENSDTFHSL